MALFAHATAWVGLVGVLASFSGCSGGIAGGGACDYGGKSYAAGDSFAASDGCNECQCLEDGEVACTDKACLPTEGCTYDGKHYDVGSTFADRDGCNDCTCDADGRVSCTLKGCGGICESIEAERDAELAKVQQCTTDADCGQPIPGSSCGCTRDLVARADASLDHYLELQEQAAEACDVGGSTCDCPEADGYACVNQRCAWNYTAPEPEPACVKHEGGQLCVRGTPTADGELLEVGDELSISVDSEGCFSSSCSKVYTADCSITEGDGFDVAASFCVANTEQPGQGCTADCGAVRASCSFSQPLTAGEHQVKLGSIVVGFQVPTKLPLGGLCAGDRF